MNLGRQKPSAGQALMFGNRARPVRKHGLPVLALAALTLLFYRDVLRAGPQAIIHGSDLSQAYYWKVYSKHLLLEGILPFWNSCRVFFTSYGIAWRRAPGGRLLVIPLSKEEQHMAESIQIPFTKEVIQRNVVTKVKRTRRRL